MKLPKNFLNTTSAAKYREYLKLLPNMEKENTRIITTLILTFLAMSFFGIFAINPTISTIVKLRKQLSDSRLVYESLKTKVDNLYSLSTQYTNLEPELSLIEEAIPTEPQAPMLMGQVLGLAKEKRISITSFDISGVQLTPNKKETSPSFTFSIKGEGSYELLMDFAKSLTNINRIITIESISINKEVDSNNLTLSLVCKAYFRN